MDPIDRAAEEEEITREAALRQRKPEGPTATGYCLFCDEPLTHGRWCDADCRDDWENQNRRH